MADPSLLRLLDMLPQILLPLQIAVYFILAWFFGAIALKGLKKHLIFPVRMVLTLSIGFLCVVSGSVIAGYIPFLQDKILRLFQIDITVGSIISSVIFALSFYLITRKFERTDPKTLIEKLRKRVGLLEGILVEHKISPIKKDEAKKIAERAVPGYVFKDAKLNKTEWEVVVQKGKKKARVVMGAYDGGVKTVEYEMSKVDFILSHPSRIVGVGIIIFLIAFSFLNFKGFPSMAEDISSLFSLSPGDLTGIVGKGEENLPKGCISAASLALKYNPKLPVFENKTIETMIENRSGTDIQWMYRIDYEGTNYILAVDSNFENICSATEEKFCQCIKIPLL